MLKIVIEKNNIITIQMREGGDRESGKTFYQNFCCFMGSDFF